MKRQSALNWLVPLIAIFVLIMMGAFAIGLTISFFRNTTGVVS